MKKLCIVLTVILFVISCGETDFKKFSQLGETRIVAIVADTPEIDGSSTGNVNVTLTPYISDINGAGRVFNVTVVTCLDTGVTRGGSPECENATTETYPNSNTYDTTNLAASNFTGAMDPITLTISNPASLIADYSNQQRFNGVNYLVAFRFQSGSTTINTIKAIPISERSVRNSNPVITGITYNGGVISSGPTASGALNMSLSSGSESYDVMQANGTVISKQESLLISWFVSKGKVQPARIVESQNSTYFPENNSAITLIGVARDRRGGSAVTVLNP